MSERVKGWESFGFDFVEVKAWKSLSAFFLRAFSFGFVWFGLFRLVRESFGLFFFGSLRRPSLGVGCHLSGSWDECLLAGPARGRHVPPSRRVARAAAGSGSAWGEWRGASRWGGGGGRPAGGGVGGVSAARFFSAGKFWGKFWSGKNFRVEKFREKVFASPPRRVGPPPPKISGPARTRGVFCVKTLPKKARYKRPFLARSARALRALKPLCDAMPQNLAKPHNATSGNFLMTPSSRYA